MIISLGHDFSKGPLSGLRRKANQQVITFGTSVIVFVSGMNVKTQYVKANYTEYLGENYNLRMKRIKKTSTIVSNHVSWLDGFIFYNKLNCAMSADHIFSTYPFIKYCLWAVDTIFMPRAKSDEDKEKAL